MFEEDYVVRIVKQVAAVIARLLGKRDPEAVRQAVDEAERTAEDLFGLPPGLVDICGTSTLRELVRAEALPSLADLLDAQAELFDRAGDRLRAERRRGLARDLR